ncbi:hypothetical protein GWK47_000828 [Chionoecetes opilio]|uniref:Uncharacterized protein n=1 Tax=Chionoecetes opilio TaxID=41210 RepID=A0A8J4YAJ4_CHIOP|nr:hypothetical protein GWK47_000828 [Chionoecetes opilio]
MMIEEATVEVTELTEATVEVTEVTEATEQCLVAVGLVAAEVTSGTTTREESSEAAVQEPAGCGRAAGMKSAGTGCLTIQDLYSCNPVILSLYPNGHWRGGRRGGGRGGGPRRSHYKDDDTEMSGPREKNRRQDQYKRRGGRPHHHMNHANNRMGWHKMMIRDGGNLDRQEVMEGIRSLVHEPFIPILVRS